MMGKGQFKLGFRVLTTSVGARDEGSEGQGCMGVRQQGGKG